MALTIEETSVGHSPLETAAFSPAVPAVLDQEKASASRFYFLQVLLTALPITFADVVGSLTAVCLSAGLIELFVPNVSIHIAQPLIALGTTIFAIYPMLGLFPGVGVSAVAEFRQFVLAITGCFVVLIVGNAVFSQLSGPEAAFLLTAWAGTLMLIPMLRTVVRSALMRCRWWGHPVVVVGAGAHGAGIFQRLQERPSLDLRPVGIVDEPHMQWETTFPESARYLGSPAEIAEICERYRAFWVIVAVADDAAEEVLSLVHQLGARIPNVLFVPAISGLPILWNRSQECAGKAGFHVREQLLLPIPKLLKRAVDVTLAVVGGILISPLLLLIGLCIKLNSPGPVLFSHPRIGHQDRRFRIWKFRTMSENADELLEDYLEAHPELRGEWERKFKLRSDPRVIKLIGHFLRKTSLDELPQLWNVIRGEMSLVGPRPIGCGEVNKYSSAYHHYRKVRPGMTGLWQVSGRSLTTYEVRLELDSYYVRNWSPWLDAYILVRTVKTVLLCEGAY